MRTFILKRVLASLTGLFLTISFVFFALRVLPGGPFDGDRTVPVEVQRALQTHYGLDQSVFKQYAIWIGHLFKGELGVSYSHQDFSILELISHALVPSLTLGILALSLSLICGIALAFVESIAHRRYAHRLTWLLSILCMSFPSYLSASCLILFFSLYLGVLPPALWESPLSAILPAIALSIRPTGMIARMLSESLSNVLTRDYIRTCYAKGMSGFFVFLKHALPNALLPLIAILGPITADLLTGSFVIEGLFQIPGLGKFFVASVLNRDYPLALSITLFYGFFLVTLTLTSDILCAYIDPKYKERLLKATPHLI